MKSKKGLIAIIAILSVLIISGGTLAVLWFFTDIFNFLKPTNDVFANQIEKAFNLEGAKFSNYSELLKEYKDISEKSSKSKMNIGANLNLTDLDSDVQKTINNSKLTLETSNDVKNNKTQNKLGLYTNNSEVLTLDLVTNDSKIGIGCTDLYDKYLAVSVEDFVEYMKENSKDIDSDTLETLTSSLSSAKINPYDLLYISDEDLKHFDEKYGNILNTLISKDCYTSEKNVEIEVDGDDIKTTAYYLTLTGKDAAEFIEKLAKLIEDDDVLTRIITEKVNMIMESTGEKITENDVKDLFNELTEQLKDAAEDIKDEEDSAIQIAVYSKGTDPVRVELNTIDNISKKDKKETIASIEYSKSKQIYTIYNDGTAYIAVENEMTKNSKTELAGKLSIKMSGMSLGTVNYEFIDKDDETKIDVDVNIPMAQVSGSIKMSTKGNYKKEAVTFEGSIAFKYASQSVKITFDGSSEFTNNISIPELTSSNSVDILKMSETDMQKELTKILEKAAEVLPSRLKLLGIDIDSSKILPTTPSIDDTTIDTNINTNISIPSLNTDEIKEKQKEILETQKEITNSINTNNIQIPSLNR